MATDPRAPQERLDRPVTSRSPRRRALSALTDDWLAELWRDSGAEELGACLVAVGGYGRRELTAGSDLDLVLLLPDHLDTHDSRIEEVGERLWYPIWDSGTRVDHSLRTVGQARRMAAQDFRVILGLLDLRVIAGDRELGERAASAILSDWRALARTRLDQLRDASIERRRTQGELAHRLEPDLKEAYGGLRDSTVLRAVSASWVTDVPRDGLDEAHERLLDVRDALHDVLLADGRRPNDTLRTQDQPSVADRLDLRDREELLRVVSESARTIAYAADTTWRRVDRLLRQPASRLGRRRMRKSGPERVPLADGVVAHDGEVVFAADARADRDPVLLLRMAAAAAQAGLPLAPATVSRLAREAAPMPSPWPQPARDALVSLLGAGDGLVPVWEALDRQGLISRLIPEWEAVRSAPQSNPVHLYRVDRHLVETAARACDQVRDVARPDLLLVAALLHDIGKARGGDHSDVGAELTATMAPRLGFNEDETLTLVRLVRHHLLLADVATRRDLDDPLTIQAVADAVESQRCLELLRGLTIADAHATGPGAWSEWKSALVDDLVRRTAAVLSGDEPVSAPSAADRHAYLLATTEVEVILESGEPTASIIVAAPDRSGLLATIAGVLALHRLEVKSADTQTVGDRAVTAWAVVPFYGDFPALDLVRSDIIRALDGQLNVEGKLAERRRERSDSLAPPRVVFVPGAASEADVLEVRAHDAPGLLNLIARAISEADVIIVAARVATLGSEVVDAFYLNRPDGDRLSTDDRARVVGRVLDRLLEGVSNVAGDGSGTA
ncbi:MAG: [protein-PII] uridylyltransferase [Candidatus Nanopelagicales bacterium]